MRGMTSASCLAKKCTEFHLEYLAPTSMGAKTVVFSHRAYS